MLAVFPKFFKRIVFALFFGENVDDDVKGIDNAPPTVRFILDANLSGGNNFVNRFFELDAERTQVRVGRSRGNYVIIRDGGFFPEVNDFDRRGFFLFERGDATLYEPDTDGGIFLHDRNLFLCGGLLGSRCFFGQSFGSGGRRCLFCGALSGRASTARGSFCQLRFGGGALRRARFLGGGCFLCGRHDCCKVYGFE